MTWADVGEVVKMLGATATAGAAWFAAYTAFRGLEKWRAETIGKRKAELAEDVLADFYQARDIINAARSSGGFVNEGRTREREDWESEDDTRILNAYYRTSERLASKADFFAQLYARHYRFIAIFGKNAAKPYNDLLALRSEILIAVRMLITSYRHRERPGLQDNIERWEAKIGWGLSDDDPYAHVSTKPCKQLRIYVGRRLEKWPPEL